MKMIIVGVTKCGTSSLFQWLKDQGHDVVNFQTLATLQHGTMIYQTHYADRKPILIFRNYEDRQRSFKAYFPKVKDQKGQTSEYHIENIKAQWRSYDPLIFTLEDLCLDPTFPLINQRERLI